MIALAIVAGVAAELCALGLCASAAWLIARAGEQPPLAALTLAIVAVRAFASSRGVFRYLERIAGHDAALRSLAGRRVRLFRALVRAPARRDGEALTHMVSDLDALQDLLLRCALPAVIAGCAGGAGALLCTVLHPAAGAVVICGLILAGAVIPALGALAARHLGARLSAARTRLAVRTLDLSDGRPDLVVFGAEDTAVAAAEHEAVALARLERVSGTLSAAAQAAGLLVQGGTAIGVAVVSAPAGPVLSAVLVLTSVAAVEATLPLISAAQHFVELRPAVRRVRALLRAPETPSPEPHEDPAHAYPGHAYPGHGDHDHGDLDHGGPGTVRLRSVSVRYGDAAALDRVDLELTPGRSVAVIGESGAGKSTLLGVLAGSIPPGEGEARLRPARGLYQDAYVFDSSVRANLLLARPGAADTDLLRALEQAGLLSWLGTLTDGLDSRMGQGGERMSGGQRQRLLLARALLSDPEVLLLDEPTEALEPAAGRAVLARVLSARRGRTTVVVTHRLDTLSLFDEVITLERGRIAVPPGPREPGRAPEDLRTGVSL